jgi:hypothetical protein
MDLMGLVLSLVSGIVGGNVAGAAMQDKSLGAVGNSIAGLLGGGAGSMILQAFGLLSASGAGGGMDLGSLVGNIAGGGVGGALVLLIVSLIKGATAKA